MPYRDLHPSRLGHIPTYEEVRAFCTERNLPLPAAMGEGPFVLREMRESNPTRRRFRGGPLT